MVSSEAGSIEAIYEAWGRPAEDFEIVDYGRALKLKSTGQIVAKREFLIWSPCLEEL